MLDMSKSGHRRKNYKTELSALPPEPISMVDHTGELASDLDKSEPGNETPFSIELDTGANTDGQQHEPQHRHQGWAKNVAIPEYDTIEGQFSKANAYVVWVIKIEKLTGGIMTICRRYSEFDQFRQRLVREYPTRIKEIPELPPKSVIAKFRPDFLEERRKGLQFFLLCVLLNPSFAYTDAVKEFVRT